MHDLGYTGLSVTTLHNRFKTEHETLYHLLAQRRCSA
jgi:hypothetical protein